MIHDRFQYPSGQADNAYHVTGIGRRHLGDECAKSQTIEGRPPQPVRTVEYATVAQLSLSSLRFPKTSVIHSQDIDVCPTINDLNTIRRRPPTIRNGPSYLLYFYFCDAPRLGTLWYWSTVCYHSRSRLPWVNIHRAVPVFMSTLTSIGRLDFVYGIWLRRFEPLSSQKST